MDLLYLFFICLLGGIIQGTTGFGFAIFAMPLLPFILPLKTAAVIVLLSSLVMTAQAAFQLREHVNIKLLLYSIVAVFIGRTIGMHILMNYQEDTLRILLGCTLVSLSVYFAFYNNKVKIKVSNRNGAIAGLISGIMGGMFNIGGPPLVIYYLSAAKDKMEYNATIQATFVLSAFYSMFLHLLYGNINTKVLQLSVVGIVGASLGCYVGLLVFKKISNTTLRKVVYSFMAVMGIMIIIK